jgi:hypothetical protein
VNERQTACRTITFESVDLSAYKALIAVPRPVHLKARPIPDIYWPSHLVRDYRRGGRFSFVLSRLAYLVFKPLDFGQWQTENNQRVENPVI